DDERTGSMPYATISKSVGDVEVAQFEVTKLPKARISTVVKPAGALKKGRLGFLEWSTAVADDVPLADPAPIEPLLRAKHTLNLRGGMHKARVQAPGYETLTRPLLVYENKSFLLTLNASKAATGDSGLESLGVPARASRGKRGTVSAGAVDRL